MSAAENPHCDYCGAVALFLPTSEAIYNGTDYGPAYVCWPCDAWVGCHPRTVRPLGRLANKELRQWKMKVHAAFDPVWKARYERKHAADPKYKKGVARGGRYKALALLMCIPKQECHIGMFDVERCKQAIEVIKTGALEREVL